MKKVISALFIIFLTTSLLSGQKADPAVSNCLTEAGTDAKYLKDFRIQLGPANTTKVFRYKASMALWKNTKYRLVMCSAETSKGKLILNIVDDENNTVASSVDSKTGTVYSYVDFKCNKSGLYKLCYDFTDGKGGSGVGIVSLVK